jgi:hypothetical protein
MNGLLVAGQVNYTVSIVAGVGYINMQIDKVLAWSAQHQTTNQLRRGTPQGT